MLLVSFSWLKSEKFWRFAITTLFLLGFLGGVYLGALLIYPPAPGSFGLENTAKKLPASKEKKKNYDGLLTGAFSVSEGGSSRFLPVVLREVEVLGANTRPGHRDADKILVKFRSTGEQRVLDQSVPFHLNLENQEAVMKVTPVGVRHGGAVMQVGLVGSDEEVAELVIEKSRSHLSQSPYFKQLISTKWWGVDTLIRHYGDGEYASKKLREKIELSQKEATSFFFVGMGDLMIWEEGLWKEVTSEIVTEGKPLAQVTQITPQLMEVTVWDETGFYSETVKLTPQASSKRPLQLNQLPSAIRLRNESQISCLLAKRRMLLKEGDWVLNTSHGWRVLQTAQEIDDYLAHRLKGELFIFDKLDTQSQRPSIHGHYFDEIRTQMQKVSIPVSTEKKSPKRTAAKKTR